MDGLLTKTTLLSKSETQWRAHFRHVASLIPAIQFTPTHEERRKSISYQQPPLTLRVQSTSYNAHKAARTVRNLLVHFFTSIHCWTAHRSDHKIKLIITNCSDMVWSISQWRWISPRWEVKYLPKLGPFDSDRDGAMETLKSTTPLEYFSPIIGLWKNHFVTLFRASHVTVYWLFIRSIIDRRCRSPTGYDRHWSVVVVTLLGYQTRGNRLSAGRDRFSSGRPM